MIDLYCERVAPGLFAEPLNALTNAAFFLAAWASWSLARHMRADSAGIRLLLALMVAIGIGSTLFHTLATSWARVLDELPILLFQLCYLWMYLRNIVRAGAAGAAACIAGYLLAAMLARQIPHLLNGSLVYAPALVAMLALGLHHWLRSERERLLLAAAAAIFAVSLAFRLSDQAACTAMPMGTHFIWHVLNGIVLYLSLRALILKST